MCFSAEASFISGGLIGLIGGATLPKVRYKAEWLFASMPLWFALHQFEEGLIWLSLEDHLPSAVGAWAKWFYIVYAHALLPTFSPLMILLIEPGRIRRRLLGVLVVIGLALSSFACWSFSRAPIEDDIVNHSIQYQDYISGNAWFATLYIITTCVPLFLSSYRWIIFFGVVNLLGLLVTALFKKLAFTSVWCAFAAVASVFVYMHFQRLRRVEATTGDGAAAQGWQLT
ncbi:MAG TPA: DUF6629 family protein [Pirellulales bacterium]